MGLRNLFFSSWSAMGKTETKNNNRSLKLLRKAFLAWLNPAGENKITVVTSSNERTAKLGIAAHSQSPSTALTTDALRVPDPWV